MLYLVCFICPPLGVLLTGRIGSAVLNLVLTLLFYFPGLIHSLIVVADYKANQRTEVLIEAINPVMAARRKQVNVPALVVMLVLFFIACGLLLAVVNHDYPAHPATAPAVSR